MKRKALILFAGIGGFCQDIDWTDWEVTAVEFDSDIAKCYQDRFPAHKVIVADAMTYMLDHYKEFDFIQTSPPCQSHSRLRYGLGVCGGKCKPVYCDPMLWQSLIFLETEYLRCRPDGIYLCENVQPYYDSFIRFLSNRRLTIGRHLVWTNAELLIFDPKQAPNTKGFSTKSKTGRIRGMNLENMKEQTGIDLSAYPKIKNKRQVLRNMFEPELGKFIFDAIYNK